MCQHVLWQKLHSLFDHKKQADEESLPVLQEIVMTNKQESLAPFF
jgi:hypothetical protein